VARGITTPARLGIMGGSNGGLLMGIMLTRFPELFGAVVAMVPLLDMRRYTKPLAGSSWIAEYGDPDEEADWAFLRALLAVPECAARPAVPAGFSSPRPAMTVCIPGMRARCWRCCGSTDTTLLLRRMWRVATGRPPTIDRRPRCGR
jgi:prolyl oligopeptidase